MDVETKVVAAGTWPGAGGCDYPVEGEDPDTVTRLNPLEPETATMCAMAWTVKEYDMSDSDDEPVA